MLICKFAFASGKTEDPTWFKCLKDEECVDIRYPCAGGTVNKKYQKEANEFYQHENAVRNCIASPNNDKNLPPFKVFCKEQKCGSQGKNPKMGFS